ncbi:MAG: hypothetical protein KDB53_10910, partial [Planctomycetes bacterium]|nr:hypothetical protein [Planctomycetota bacterium]
MRVIGCLWIVWACLARLAVAQTIESFDGELKKANALAERGRFGDAKSRLDELLQDCEHQDLARQRQREIIDLATLCAFQIEYPDVEAKDVVQGDLRSWNPRTGKIKVVYDANWRDFELQNGIRFHKALATGPFTLEISGSSYSNADPVQGWGPVDDQGGIYVSFGRGLNGQTYYPARAFSFDGKDWKMVDEKETSPVDPGKPFKLKYRVDDGSAKAYSSGRMLVSGRKERKQWGSWGFAGSGIERVEFTGTIEPAWIQGEIDSVRQENRRRFDRSFDSRQVLPAWLFEAAIVQVIGNGKTAERRFPGQLNDTQRRVAEQLHHLSFQRAWKSGLAELKRDGERLPAITSDWFSSVFLSGDGQVGEALKFVEAVVGADPTFYAGRALRASLLGRTRRRTESIAAWRELSKSHSGESETFEQTAFLLLEDAQLSEARETLAEAGRHGHRSDEIKALEELIYRADRGPQWGRTYRHQSAHYDISTDIDDQAARNAARVL